MSLKRNVVANFAGYGWAALMGIAFLPAYVKTLGAEAYGLVGVYTVMQAWLSMLDLGLTPTLNREMARLRAGLHTPITIRDLLRSIELVFAAVATCTVILVWVGAGPMTDHWLQTRNIPRQDVVEALHIIGFVLASRWLEQIYRAALLGMQDQVVMNVIQGVAATLRWGGAYVVITFVAPSILAFFVWQGISSVFTTFLLMYRTYHMLPKAARSGRANRESLSNVRNFASGMLLTSILVFLLTQADKIVISKMLPMDQLGFYMLASSAAGALLLIVTPLNNAIYPRLTELVALQNVIELENTYRLGCELMAAILIPAALVLAIFSGPVLMMWTGDMQITRMIAPILSVLAMGTLFNGLANMPYMLQLAHGWTSLSVILNAIAVIVLLPLMFVAVTHLGSLGAAFSWLALNAISLLVSVQVMYRRILPATRAYWYRYALFAPLSAGAAFGLISFYLLPTFKTRLGAATELLFCAPPLLAIVLLMLPNLRVYLWGWLQRRRDGGIFS